MDEKQRRALLNRHTELVRDIELSEVAIKVLESMGTSRTTTSCIAKLRKMQRLLVPAMDKVAAKLGAPYPSITP